MSTSATRIAFSSNRDGNFEIYTMTSDGKDVQRLTNSPSEDRKPAWNRDHSKIAFVSDRDGNSEIYVLNVVDGRATGQPQRVTNNPAHDRAPSWNPNGTQLVFESNRGNQQETALYIVDVGTRVTRRFTERPGFSDSSPKWSPRGDLIAFQSQPINDGGFREGPPSRIYLVKTDGQGLKELTHGHLDSDASWHPNGDKIVYRSSTLNISVIGLNSEEPLELIFTDQGDYRDPVYSRDGSQIAHTTYASVGEFQEERDTINIFLSSTKNLVEQPKEVDEQPKKSTEQPKKLTDNVFLNQDISW